MTDEGKITLSEFSGDYNYTYNETYYEDSCCGQVCGQHNSMQFEAIFIPMLYSVALIVGLLGNGIVLAVLWQKRRVWSVTDTFILHLTVADTLLLLTMPLWAAEAADQWRFGTVLCKLTGVLFKINFYCGIFLLACISLDRYLSVVHAVQMYSRRKPWLIQLSCLTVWFFCLLLSIPDWLYLSDNFDPRRGKIECTHLYPSKMWRLSSRLLYHMVGFLIPAMVMLYCYSCIILRLQRGFKGMQKQRAMRVILALVLSFFISWTPYNITLLVETISSKSTFCESATVLDVAVLATSTLGYLHSCLNPVLYAFVGVKFRRHLLEMTRPLSYRLKVRVTTASRRSSVWSESADTSNTSAF